MSLRKTGNKCSIKKANENSRTEMWHKEEMHTSVPGKTSLEKHYPSKASLKHNMVEK